MRPPYLPPTPPGRSRQRELPGLSPPCSLWGQRRPRREPDRRCTQAAAGNTQSAEGEAVADTETDTEAPPDTEAPVEKNSDGETAAPAGAPAAAGPNNSASAPADAPATPASPAAPTAPAAPAAAAGAAAPPKTPGGPPRPGRPATPAGGRPSGAPLVPAGAAGGPAAASPAARASAARKPPQHTQIIAPPQEPWHQRLFGSTRNLLLAIAGVLVLGIGVAFALSQFSSDDAEPGTDSAQQQTPAGEEQPAVGDEEQADRRQQPAIDPATVTVAVLNGTTVPGLAQSLSDEVTRLGFDVGTVANSGDAEGQQRAESVILYANGSEREASVVGRRLGIPQREPIDAATQGLAGDATVVVIAGADRQ